MVVENPGSLEGIRVLDLTSVVMGPLATAILGDLGADVITVESRRGDINRFMGAGPHPHLSGVSLNLLRNKRNLDLDLKSETGREVLLRLAATCDVFVTNLRPGALARLGATYPDIALVRPDVIYCQAHGWPSDSDRADEPAYDDIIQAASGLADLAVRAGGEAPGLMPTIVADKVSGLTIVYAVLAALFHRERTGQGQRIEVPMVDVVSAFLLVEHGAGAIPQPPAAPPGYKRILTPERRPQRTRDGWINVLPYDREHYDTLFTVGGRPDLVGDPRYATGRDRIANSDFLYGRLREIIAGRTTAEWLEICNRHGIPAAAIGRLEDLVDALPEAEHPVAGRYKVIPPPIRFGRTPASVRRPAPLIGEHNREVLAEIGFTDEEITELTEQGVLRESRRRRD
ncbi:CaiB/BaiF CoA transferase family protein [Nonomuraea sediminis]|uniref:CaiB/BaiF CoA transferase family protein n=1 Tax=Nonomuraea sediminis TaxID=2835864 RepID=UPI001BDC4649|nr:CoA transferase [Nonomuraea sediminis]